jgi:transcriptional regulator with XRE-family HTH domain
MDSLQKKIVWNIGKMLERLNLSQAQLAREIDMDPAQLNPYLKGKRKMPMTVVSDIADALGVEVEELLSAPPAPDAPPREPNEIELLAKVVERFDIHPARKSLILGLLKNLYLEQERADLIEFALNADKMSDLRTVLKTAIALKAPRAAKAGQGSESAG